MFKPPIVPRQSDGPQALRTSFPAPFSVPFACGSFLFFHAVKWLLDQIRRVRERNKESLDWYTISEVLGRPLALPYIMVTGPRWNPHALISRVGPFQVKHALRIRVDTAHRSAQMWTLIIYRGMDPRAVAAIISDGEAQGDDGWHEQTLPPGRYSATLRYYEWFNDPRLPEVEIDGSHWTLNARFLRTKTTISVGSSISRGSSIRACTTMYSRCCTCDGTCRNGSSGESICR